MTESARENDFKWVLARALTAYGSHTSLSDSPNQLIERLNEALQLYEQIGAESDSARTLFYLAVRLNIEGSSRRSFNLVNQATGRTAQDDHKQRFQFSWIASRNRILQRTPLAFKYHAESAERARLADRPDGVAYAHIGLAQLYETESRPELADYHISLAEAAAEEVDFPLLRELLDVDLRLGKATILANRGQGDSAEQLLTDGLTQLAPKDIRVFYEQQYRMKLAKEYVRSGEDERAKLQFSLAVEAVEREDNSLEPPARLTFDEQRREVYEAAIAFEFDRDSRDAARAYARRYRTKLLTEAIGQYTSGEQALVERVASVREGLDNLGDGRILEYTLLEDRLLMWVRSRNTVEGRSYTIERDDLQAMVERFLDLMNDLDRVDEVNALAKELHTILIDPVIDLLEGAGSVTIVPDRMLHRLPFAALRSPEDRYLIEDYVLAETLNAPYFLNLPASSPDTGKLVSIGSQEQISSIRIELARLDDIYAGVDSFNGPEVDRTLFLDAMDDASLFHYAGHSALDGTNALSSSILLDGNVDGPNTVTASEIASRRLATNALVILASCDSSVGNSIGGVGFRGLTSAFLIAGAGSVVGSLWPVESTATTQLMLRFHRDLAKGASIAAALQTAQLSVLAERPHPYFWSGFTVTGNRSALQAAPFVTAEFAMAAAEPSL